MTKVDLFARNAPHPGAAASFDRAAMKLLRLFESVPRRAQAPEPFKTRHHVEEVHVISSDPVSARVDFNGRTIGWSYLEAGEDVTLLGDGYRALRVLVERIRRKPPFNQGFSDHFLERAVAIWCASTMRGDELAGLTEYLLEQCADACAEHVYVVPLTNVEIEHDFAIGNVRLITIQPALFEAAAEEARTRHPNNPSAGEDRETLGRQLGNLVGVEVITTGEPRFARERSLAVADELAGVLRFLSPAAISSTVPSLVQPLGRDPSPQTFVIRLKDGRLAGLDREWLHVGLAQWKLPGREIDRLAETSLANLAHFFDGRPLGDYATHLRPAFFAYCRAIGRYESADRLVGTITALERLLLRHGNEPLQHSVGERLAFLTASNAQDRMRTVANYRKAYALRSRAVHHLAGIGDEEVADRLFRHAFLAFHQAIRGLSIFTTHQQFLDGIDQVKFGGRYCDSGDASPQGADPLE
jgi:hypothetical protein